MGTRARPARRRVARLRSKPARTRSNGLKPLQKDLPCRSPSSIPPSSGPSSPTAWQQYLNTGEDPANGQWYTSGPNGGVGGLYGALTDTAASTLNLQSGQQSVPQAATVNVAVTDNRAGKVPTATVSLSSEYSVTSS